MPRRLPSPHPRRGGRRLAWVLAGMLLVPSGGTALEAQDREQRTASASFGAGASVGDGNTALALSAALGAPIASRFRLDVELAYARRLDFTLDLCPPPRVCGVGGQAPVTGRAVSLVPHLVVRLGPATPMRVYVLAGVGAGHVRQRYHLAVGSQDGWGRPVEHTRSSLVPVVSFGGGLAAPLSPRLSVAADLRSVHLFDDRASLDRYITPSGALSTVRILLRAEWQF